MKYLNLSCVVPAVLGESKIADAYLDFQNPVHLIALDFFKACQPQQVNHIPYLPVTLLLKCAGVLVTVADTSTGMAYPESLVLCLVE